MSNINFLLTGAQFLMSLFDIKQRIITGSVHSNSFFANERLASQEPSARSSQIVRDAIEIPTYTNPLLRTNVPDPGVFQLVDGSGWVLVSTTNNASKEFNSLVFPLYYSKGKCD